MWAPASSQFWYTGGGLHPWAPVPTRLHPDPIGGLLTLRVGQMAIANKTTKLVLPSLRQPGPGGRRLVRVHQRRSTARPAVRRFRVIVGRALGATHSAMDDARGGHDLRPGDPWYLKRFFVDGHEYNVVALYTTRAADHQPGRREL